MKGHTELKTPMRVVHGQTYKCSRNSVILHQQNQQQLSKIKIRHLLNIVLEQEKKKGRNIQLVQKRSPSWICTTALTQDMKAQVERKRWREKDRGKKGSSHGICFKIQLVVNISPDRITLKPPTAVPTVSQRCFATMRRRKLSGSLEIPMI